MTEEIHDMSRVDSFMASRRRAMFFHSVWKPMLAGAVGAAIMSAAVIGSVWVILPKISVREVTVDHVIQKDVPFDNHVPQDKPFDNYVPHAKPFDLPVPKSRRRRRRSRKRTCRRSRLQTRRQLRLRSRSSSIDRSTSQPTLRAGWSTTRTASSGSLAIDDNIFFPSKLDPMGVEADTGVADPNGHV